MPRKNLIRSSIFPYHVSNRANNREWYELPLEVNWKIFCDIGFRVSVAYGSQFHAMVLMSNHVHMILSTPYENLDQIMTYFNREIAREHNKLTGRINHLFGGRYRWSLIQHPLYYANAIKYVYRNPVQARITTKVEEYPYSTLFESLGGNKLNLPLFEPKTNFSRIIPQTTDKLLEWLNRPYLSKESEAIRKALRKAEYAYSQKLCQKVIKRLTDIS